MKVDSSMRLCWKVHHAGKMSKMSKMSTGRIPSADNRSRELLSENLGLLETQLGGGLPSVACALSLHCVKYWVRGREVITWRVKGESGLQRKK